MFIYIFILAQKMLKFHLLEAISYSPHLYDCNNYRKDLTGSPKFDI
jgi:hypothetical protein